MGSVIIFLMVKKWGRKILGLFVSKKKLDKYLSYLEDGKRFEKWFASVKEISSEDTESEATESDTEGTEEEVAEDEEQ